MLLLQERLFTQHTGSLATKRRDKLRGILTELGVSCTSQWKDVKELLKTELTAPVYSNPLQVQHSPMNITRKQFV